MPSLFSGINTALRAMLAHQQAIQIIEHNVANANTPGYRRQEAILGTTAPYPAPQIFGGVGAGQVGTGVMVQYIKRFNMDFFDGRYRRELGETKRWELQREALQQIEVTLSETSGDGLIDKLDAFWSGWQALAADPSNMVLRADLKERAGALAEGFNWRAESLLALRRDQELSIAQRVEEVNLLADHVARLNGEISNVSAAGSQPNDLLDERDRALDRLSELTGATVSIQEDGHAVVSIGGHALVVGSEAFHLTTAPDPGNAYLSAISWEADGQAISLSRGEIYGLLDARDRVIPAQLDGLNQAAEALVNQVNALHQTGFGLNNNTGLDFFAPFTTTNYAAEIKLSANLDDLNNIAAASAADAPGDGNIAVAIANLQNQAVLSGGTMTINEFYGQQIGNLGLELRNADQSATDHMEVVTSLELMRESVTGVSLDEEAAKLVQAQRSFQAAARLMTTIDEMLDTVINGLGLAGR